MGKDMREVEFMFFRLPVSSVTQTVLLILISICMGLSVLSASARAACPAYTPDLSLLKELADLPHLSPEERQRLKEHFKTLSQTKDPVKLGEVGFGETLARSFRPTPLPYPLIVPVPFTVEATWGYYPVPNPVRIEVDMDGDGKPEWVESRYEAFLGRQYTYQKEGEYQYTVRIQDGSGNINTYRTLIKALSPAAFDAEMRNIWSSLREALQRGDLSAAMDCIYTRYRSDHQKTLREIMAGGPQHINEVFVDLELHERRRGAMIFLRAVPKGWIPVHFEIDADGAWRISLF